MVAGVAWDIRDGWGSGFTTSVCVCARVLFIKSNELLAEANNTFIRKFHIHD